MAEQVKYISIYQDVLELALGFPFNIIFQKFMLPLGICIINVIIFKELKN